MIQMMSAMINRMPTIVQIKFLFMSNTVRDRPPQGNAEKAEVAWAGGPAKGSPDALHRPIPQTGTAAPPADRPAGYLAFVLPTFSPERASDGSGDSVLWMEMLEDRQEVNRLAKQSVRLKQSHLAPDDGVVTRGDHQNRHGALFSADLPEQLKAIPVGQVQVEDDRRLTVEQFGAALQRAGRLDEEPLERK